MWLHLSLHLRVRICMRICCFPSLALSLRRALSASLSLSLSHYLTMCPSCMTLLPLIQRPLKRRMLTIAHHDNAVGIYRCPPSNLPSPFFSTFVPTPTSTTSMHHTLVGHVLPGCAHTPIGRAAFGVAGLVDASECPPTYNATHEDVRGFLDGGYETLSRRHF